MSYARRHSTNVCPGNRVRYIPSVEYETILSGIDYLRKVWRFSRRGFVAHVHVNGKSAKGFVVAVVAEILNLVSGQRSVLTFHAGCDQTFFPRPKYPLLLPMFWLMFTIPRTIICNDEDMKAEIVRYGVDEKKIWPIPAFSQQYLDGESVALPIGLEGFYARFSQVVFCYINILAIYYPETALDGFAKLATGASDIGLVFCGTGGHRDEQLWKRVQAMLDEPYLRERVAVVEDLPHEGFIEALRRSSVYLRTPPSDGVASSVLEALSLRVPVVAAENGHRPGGVWTYPAADADALAATLADVLVRREEIVAEMSPPKLSDTVAEEVRLLTDCTSDVGSVDSQGFRESQ